MSLCVSAARNLRDQINLRPFRQLCRIGVLVDHPVDRHRHPVLDLLAEAWEALVQLPYQTPERGRRHLKFGPPAGELAGGRTREDDARQVRLPRAPR